MLHLLSPRDRDPWSRVCATLPSTLIDAELFGNIKNYPNAGMPERPGLVGEAHGPRSSRRRPGVLLTSITGGQHATVRNSIIRGNAKASATSPTTSRRPRCRSIVENN
jgi:hypothetical protein